MVWECWEEGVAMSGGGDVWTVRMGRNQGSQASWCRTTDKQPGPVH